ncbi:O-antigen ligase family protein [Aquimarina algiphila]|nr:O-antigen ligase family protein [Aquimarina algiphila]
MYLLFCISVVGAYLYKANLRLNLFKKTVIILTIFFFLGFILHLRSRSAILALILIVVFFTYKIIIYVYKRNRRIFFYTLFVGILLFFFFLFSTGIKNAFDKYTQAYLQRDTGGAIEERLDNWEASLGAVSESYIFGYGIGDSQKVRDKYFYIHGFDVGIDNKYNSHNQFIEILIIGGILGLILLLSMYFKLLLLYFKTQDISVLCFFTLLFVIMTTESILVRQHGIVFFSFFYVLFNKRIDEKKN